MSNQHTVSLTRARATGRQSRAQKAVSILQNELEKREGEKVKLDTTINQKIWEKGAEKPPARIQITVETTTDGKKAYLDTTTKDKTTSEKSSKDTEEVEVDLSGTVGDAKEEIKEKQDEVDLEKVLKKEKKNKDRKTLKQFIKDLMN